MARRGLTGQLNMFDLLGSPDMGEVEMVSLVPDFEEPEPVVEPVAEPEPVVEVVAEPEPVVEPEPEPVAELEPVEVPVMKEDSKVAMSRKYVIDGESIEIAYINYNKVRITRGKQTPMIKEFASSKEAVDYYVEQMQEYEADE